jgi:hypothetical protein
MSSILYLGLQLPSDRSTRVTPRRTDCTDRMAHNSASNTSAYTRDNSSIESLRFFLSIPFLLPSFSCIATITLASSLFSLLFRCLQHERDQYDKKKGVESKCQIHEALRRSVCMSIRLPERRFYPSPSLSLPFINTKDFYCGEILFLLYV